MTNWTDAREVKHADGLELPPYMRTFRVLAALAALRATVTRSAKRDALGSLPPARYREQMLESKTPL